jgi:hypothetical protein
MKLSSCYLDCLVLRHVNRLKSWVGRRNIVCLGRGGDCNNTAQNIHKHNREESISFGKTGTMNVESSIFLYFVHYLA